MGPWDSTHSCCNRVAPWALGFRSSHHPPCPPPPVAGAGGDVTEPRQTQGLRPWGHQAEQAGESWGEGVGSGWGSATLVSDLTTQDLSPCLHHGAAGTRVLGKTPHRKQDPVGLALLDSGTGWGQDQV